MGTVILGIIGYKVITMMIKETMHCSDLGKCVFSTQLYMFARVDCVMQPHHALLYPTHVPRQVFHDIHTPRAQFRTGRAVITRLGAASLHVSVYLHEPGSS
jgi:hypothetical protein